MKKAFTIEYVGTPECDKALDRALKPYQGNSTPIENIKKMLIDPPLGVKTVVFEEKYIDADYQDEFTAFYAKSFKNYSQRCTRLHFFSCDIPKDAVRFSSYKDAYRGFMVVRPTDLQRVGRTIITPPVSDANAMFVTCKADYTAHLLGEPMTVKGMPFIQQDTQVGACAQACLWMVSRYMSMRYGHRLFRPAEINEFAKAKLGLGRHLPAERGLQSFQMLDALHLMGLSAVEYSRSAMDEYSNHVESIYGVSNTTEEEKKASLHLQRTIKMADVIYRYVESGLPVILMTNNHAMVAIGHTYEFSASAQLAIQRIPDFIVNNDAEGCYRLLPIHKDGSGHAMSRINGFIAVTPAEATLSGEIAEVNAVMLIKWLLEWSPNGGTIKDQLVTVRPDFANWLNFLEYRTYLIPSTQWQADLWREIDEGFPNAAVNRQLIGLDLPKYVWVTEASAPDLLNKSSAKERCCLGRVVIDSTAPANTDAAIAMHFADMLVIRDRRDGGSPQITYNLNSTPFPHKVW